MSDENVNVPTEGTQESEVFQLNMDGAFFFKKLIVNASTRGEIDLNMYGAVSVLNNRLDEFLQPVYAKLLEQEKEAREKEAREKEEQKSKKSSKN